MSVSVLFDDGEEKDGPFALANTGEWAEFQEWAAGLPAGFEALQEFADSGSYHNSAQVAAEMRQALREHRPAVHVRRVARDLRAHMGVGDEEESVSIIL